MRADPTNGYCNDFQVYTGKEAGRVEHGLGKRVVIDLSRSITGVFNIVNCDTYFTSPELFNELLLCDTVISQKLSHRQFSIFFCRHLFVCPIK